MPLDQVQVAILTLLRGERPRLSLGVNPGMGAANVVRGLDLFARGVTLATELCVAVGATVMAVNALVRTPGPMDSIDAEGLRRLAALAATLALVVGLGAAAALRWRQWFWWIQLVVGCAVATWYLAVRAA